MTPYRESAAPLSLVASAPPRGLLRTNGSACRCRPPGLLWCWWFHVCTGDRWFCRHGGAWKRHFRYVNIIFRRYWEPEPSQQGGTGDE